VSSARALLTAAAICFAACQTVPGPEASARAYAEALREGRIDDAWALTARGTSRQEFATRYASDEARRARAEAVERAAGSLAVRSGSLLLVKDGEAWRIVEGSAIEAAREALKAFLAAAESADFAAAYALLAGELRSRYTPQRLEQDFRAEPLARERLARARAAVDREPWIQGEQVHFPIAEGAVVRLVREEAGYRVLALE
jgi:hypothetical protein